jgi:glycosyltransferase involved in cell wall biosynthesis
LTKVLRDYFALLFPIYYIGEGFAGTAIDAFSAGVPVIASDWKYNSEVIKEGINVHCFCYVINAVKKYYF